MTPLHPSFDFRSNGSTQTNLTSGGAWTYQFSGISTKSSPVPTNDDGVIFGYTDVQDSHSYLNDEGFAGPWEATPCVEGNIVYAPNLNGGIYAIDVLTGERSSGVPIETEPIYTNGLAIFAARAMYMWRTRRS